MKNIKIQGDVMVNLDHKMLQTPIFREQTPKPHKHGSAYAPEGIFKNSTYRRCPKCHSRDAIGHGKSRKYGKHRYKCKECGITFSITIDSIDTEKLFADVYDMAFKDQPHMLNIKYRIRRMFESNKKVRKFFSEIITYNINKDSSDDERDRYTFLRACKLADTLDQQEIDRYLDSWYYLANYNNGDVTYKLRYYNTILVRHFDLKLSKIQEIPKPLLHCSTCGSDDLRTYGFNNNGRRRIQCLKCKRISVIWIKNLITQEEFELMLQAYFKDQIDSEKVIQELTERLKDDYSKISVSRHFEALLAEQVVITHQLKQDLFNAFIATEYLRTIQKDILSMIFTSAEYTSFYNSYKQIPNLPRSKNIIGMHRMFHKNLIRLQDVTEDAVKYNRLFYQVSASMLNSHFHDWQHKTDKTFEQIKDTLF